MPRAFLYKRMRSALPVWATQNQDARNDVCAHERRTRPEEESEAPFSRQGGHGAPDVQTITEPVSTSPKHLIHDDAPRTSFGLPEPAASLPQTMLLRDSPTSAFERVDQVASRSFAAKDTDSSIHVLPPRDDLKTDPCSIESNLRTDFCVESQQHLEVLKKDQSLNHIVDTSAGYSPSPSLARRSVSSGSRYSGQSLFQRDLFAFLATPTDGSSQWPDRGYQIYAHPLNHSERLSTFPNETAPFDAVNGLPRHRGYPAHRAGAVGRSPARQPIYGLEYTLNTPQFRTDDRTAEDSGMNLVQVDQAQHAELCKNPTRCETAKGENITNAGTGLSTATNAPQQRKKYVCDVCGKGFSRSNTLVTHKRIHTGDKPFSCELCGRAFRQPGNLTRHRLTHTSVKPYVCQECGKAFNRASNLHTHARTHTGFKPFLCQYCGKGFHQKVDMKIHSYTHTGEKPHKCKKCGRGFKQLTHLTYHMRTHSEIRMFTCAYCGKGFNQKGNLQAHIYGHTGERPFHCEICKKGFTLASTLNTHMRTHAASVPAPIDSSKPPFACDRCGKDFYQKSALKSHMLAAHPPYYTS